MFYRRICITLLFISLYSVSCLGQQITEKEIDERLYSYESTLNSHDANLKFLKEIDSLSRAINYDHGLFEANLGIAYTERTFNTENGWRSVLVMDSLYEKNPEIYSDSLVIHYILIKGYTLGAKNDPLGELEMYFIADSIAQGNEPFQAMVNFNFSQYYQNNRQFEKALIYNRRVTEYYGSSKEDIPQREFGYLFCLNNTSVIHFSMENYDSSIYYAQKCIDGGFEKYGKAHEPYNTLGTAYFEKGDLYAAEKYARLSVKSAEENNLDGFSNTSFMNTLLIGRIKNSLGELDTASILLNEAKAIADSLRYLAGVSFVEKEFIYLKANLHDDKEINTHFNNYVRIKEQLFNESVEKKEKQLLVQFETNKKEKEILILREEKLIAKTINTIILFSLVILILIVIILIYRYRTKKKLFMQREENYKLANQISHSKLNNALGNLRVKIDTIQKLEAKLNRSKTDKGDIGRITSLLEEDYLNEAQWNELIYHFDQLNNDFSKELKDKYTDISKNEIKLLILVKMGYLNKEIAAIRNVTTPGVKKAKLRLRKKLGITDFSELSVWGKEEHVSL